MKDIYNYKENISIITTKDGKYKILCMNPEILTVINNCIFDASEKAEAEGRGATAQDLKQLFMALVDNDKGEQ